MLTDILAGDGNLKNCTLTLFYVTIRTGHALNVRLGTQRGHKNALRNDLVDNVLYISSPRAVIYGPV